MARFLGVVASAEASLTLAYPTADEKGGEPAAGRVPGRGPVAALRGGRGRRSSARTRSSTRPCWRRPPQSAAERRIQAVARAAAGDPSLLPLVAATAEQRSALRSSASALLINERRGRPPSWRQLRDPLGRHEGRLKDPRIGERIGEAFGPSYAFSASQLESLAFCPFQFFLRYVLRLDPVDDRDELEEDRTAGGSRMHRASSRSTSP